MPIRTVTTQLLQLSPQRRRLLLIAADALLLSLAVWLSFWLRLAHPFSRNFAESVWLLPEWRRGGEPGGVTEAPSGAEAAAGA